MCVISLSKAGVKVPTMTEFKAMWDKNPHGAGLMVDVGNGVVDYKKGMMTFEEFEDAFDEMSAKYNLVDRACAFHFRIKTSGKTDAPTTHPFLLSPRYEDLRKLESMGKTPVLMHNGTIPKFGGFIDALSSDTQDFAATIGYRMLRKSAKKQKPSKTMQKAIETMLGGSRILVFYGDNDPLQLGSWPEKDGVCYSNMSWAPSTTVPATRTTPSTGSYKRIQAAEPDSAGMYMNQYPMFGRDWIRFDDQKAMDDKVSYSYEKSIIEGETFYVQKYATTGTDKIKYKQIGLDLVTEKGELLMKVKDAYDRKMHLSEYPEIDDLSMNDFYVAEEPEEFYETVNNETTWDAANMRNVARDGSPVYIDYHEYTIYTERALKAVFKENWRFAKKELEMEFSMDTDWTVATEEDKKNLTKRIKDQVEQMMAARSH